MNTNENVGSHACQVGSFIFSASSQVQASGYYASEALFILRIWTIARAQLWSYR